LAAVVVVVAVAVTGCLVAAEVGKAALALHRYPSGKLGLQALRGKEALAVQR
jgi:hypothetical protein